LECLNDSVITSTWWCLCYLSTSWNLSYLSTSSQCLSLNLLHEFWKVDSISLICIFIKNTHGLYNCFIVTFSRIQNSNFNKWYSRISDLIYYVVQWSQIRTAIHVFKHFFFTHWFIDLVIVCNLEYFIDKEWICLTSNIYIDCECIKQYVNLILCKAVTCQLLKFWELFSV